MKVTVTNVGTSWKPKDNPQADPLWTINLAERAEPQKTYDAGLAVLGEHEAEEYQSKSGKTYWRLPKTSTSSYKAPQGQLRLPDDSRDSIQKQKALAEAVNFVNGSVEKFTEASRLDYVLLVAKKFLDFIENPDAVKTTKADDLSPASAYEDLG